MVASKKMNCVSVPIFIDLAATINMASGFESNLAGLCNPLSLKCAFLVNTCLLKVIKETHQSIIIKSSSAFGNKSQAIICHHHHNHQYVALSARQAHIHEGSDCESLRHHDRNVTYTYTGGYCKYFSELAWALLSRCWQKELKISREQQKWTLLWENIVICVYTFAFHRLQLIISSDIIWNYIT